MTKAEEKAIDAWAIYEYREHPKGLYHTCFVDGYKEGYEQAEKDLALTIEAAIIVYEEWHGGTMDNFIKSMDRLGELIEPLREEMFKEEQK